MIDYTATINDPHIAAYLISIDGIKPISYEEFYKQEKDYAIEKIMEQPFY